MRSAVRPLVHAYKILLLTALTFTPLAAAWYLWAEGAGAVLLVSHGGHHALIAVAGGLALAVAWVTFLCYRHSGDPYLRWLTLAFLGLGIVYAPHGILTTTDLPASPLFLLYGPASRLVMAAFLLVGLLHWSAPAEERRPATQWVAWLAVIVAVLPLVALAARSPWAPQARLVGEYGSVALLAAGAVVIVVRRLRSGLMALNLAAMALFAQSCAVFLVSPPWSHPWWAAHLIFASGFLVLSYGVARAFLTTRSFRLVHGEHEMIARLAARTAEAACARAHSQALGAAVAEAERANAAKSRFLAAASHDIRQPLVPIQLFAELLEAEITDKGALEIVGKMRASLASLDDLLSRLLDFSRIEAGGVHARSEVVPLGAVFDRFQAEFGPVTRAKGLVLRVVPSSIAVFTDRVLLEQILRNLIENAVRYTQDGRILLGCRRRGRQALVVVRDTGIGIPEDNLRSVFGEFYQVGNQNRNRRHGLGLGLATVDRLSRLLDHPITVSSAVGKGTAFSVAVPLADERVTGERAHPPVAAAVPPGMRVLVIEDDETVAEALAVSLGKMGWRVRRAGDCAQALATVAAGGVPDLVVTDLRLEAVLSGLDAIARIHDFAGRPVPAVIITGDSAHAHLAAAAAGPWPMVMKPFSMNTLCAAIAEALASPMRHSSQIPMRVSKGAP